MNEQDLKMDLYVGLGEKFIPDAVLHRSELHLPEKDYQVVRDDPEANTTYRTTASELDEKKRSNRRVIYISTTGQRFAVDTNRAIFTLNIEPAGLDEDLQPPPNSNVDGISY